MGLGRQWWNLLKCSVRYWLQDRASTIGAALAFYCAFSLAPLLIILVTISGWIIGAEMAYGHLQAQLALLFGDGTAKILIEAMESAQEAAEDLGGRAA